MHVHDSSVERDALASPQPSHDVDAFAHGLRRVRALVPEWRDADPLRHLDAAADPEDGTTTRHIGERGLGAREEGRVTCERVRDKAFDR